MNTVLWEMEYKTKMYRQIKTICNYQYLFSSYSAFLFYLHTSSQHRVKYMCSLLHDSDVFWRGVSTLTVLYGVDEAVSEFAQWAQKIPLDETDHAVICGDEISCINMRIWLQNEISVKTLCIYLIYSLRSKSEVQLGLVLQFWVNSKICSSFFFKYLEILSDTYNLNKHWPSLYNFIHQPKTNSHSSKPEAQNVLWPQFAIYYTGWCVSKQTFVWASVELFSKIHRPNI